jgi:hypothetical protein
MKIFKMALCSFLVSSLMACGSSQHEESEVKIAPAAIAAGAAAALPFADFFYKVISESIDKAKNDAKIRADRAAFISSTAEEIYHKINREASKRKIRPYNLAICGGDLHCSLRADEGIHYLVKSFNFQDRHYTLWAFRGGVLDNPTAGGWENWIVMGCHNKTWSGHGTVTFSNTAWIGGKPQDGQIGCLK